MKEIYTALITPFSKDKEVDYIALKTLVKRYVLEKHDGFIVLGTTGETPCLTMNEKIKIIHEVIKYKGNLKLIVGVGSNDTQETIQFIHRIKDIKEIDAYLVVTPYYNRPSQEGLFQHFKLIEKESTKPIIVYNVPKRTGVTLECHTLLRLIKECPLICGLKQASHDLEMIKTIKDKYPNFKVYSGEDGLLKEGLESGIDGVISVISHIYYNFIRSLFDRYQNRENINEIDQKIKNIASLCFKEASPGPIKYLLSKEGFCENVLRLPLLSISDSLKQEFERLNEMLRLQNKDMVNYK